LVFLKVNEKKKKESKTTSDLSSRRRAFVREERIPIFVYDISWSAITHFFHLKKSVSKLLRMIDGRPG